MPFKTSIFNNYQDFLLDINFDRKLKLIQMFELINNPIIDIRSYESIEYLTNVVMKKSEKSDNIFIYWFFCWGEHIKLNFSSQWALIKYKSPLISEYYYPILIDKKDQIWQVGFDCEKAYYKYNRLANISFSTFYKMHAEKLLVQSKLKDIDKSINDLIRFDN
ncbi:hypothetical protein DIS18_05390 [Algibacter marinivivus]|uniref:Uncharacterized protein n=1 Tax=Algibacter marinivivus TaxID=2100723 RepID=A0A2U2X888_9FLAO|nr:hypothetical protein [Algibacter marinivivus]PWH83982.1 hypothetical protein DIS18_05390 [Algibacter marinivivus]